MLTIREAQEKTGLSRITFQRSISNGTIRSVKQGNKFLVYEEDFHLLPKPRRTGVQTVEVPQVLPFPAMTGAELVELKKAEADLERQKTVQMLARLAGAAA